MPRVSVLIPTYNRADYLLEAIGSVLHQTFSDLEVVVVDDGSTDDTAQLVKAIADDRVRYLYQSNHGVAAALNTAWRAAQGEYLAMLGSDDLMLPDQLAILLADLDHDPRLGLVYARAQGMDPHGNSLPQILGAPPKFPGQTLKSNLYGDSVCGIACLFRKSCIEQAGGFNESLIANEDWDLWIRMAELCQFAYRDQILARFRMHPASLTGARSQAYERVILDRLRLIENYYSRVNLPTDALAVKSFAFRNVYMDVAIRYLAIGKWRAALPYLRKAIRAHGDPVTTTLRVVGVALFDLYLSKTTLGVKLVDAAVKQRRRWSRQP